MLIEGLLIIRSDRDSLEEWVESPAQLQITLYERRSRPGAAPANYLRGSRRQTWRVDHKRDRAIEVFFPRHRRARHKGLGRSHRTLAINSQSTPGPHRAGTEDCKVFISLGRSGTTGGAGRSHRRRHDSVRNALLDDRSFGTRELIGKFTRPIYVYGQSRSDEKLRSRMRYETETLRQHCARGCQKSKSFLVFKESYACHFNKAKSDGRSVTAKDAISHGGDLRAGPAKGVLPSKHDLHEVISRPS
ncbi:hypothetical protein EVAR_57823_1 [Eumeta japonica]|uniref:Uncharacterized protein n=1 Tax=Eumeta variegata TaxID=151549 RepID=A0A4C1ZZ59_EUMVA|nr:hypothetical protein EVAR_57823_1 [Eumeta japonica]